VAEISSDGRESEASSVPDVDAEIELPTSTRILLYSRFERLVGSC
jgi:hypothetical protein